MGKRIICAALALLLLGAVRVPAQSPLLEEENVVVMSVPGAQGMSVNADAAIVMEAKTGRVLFEQNIHEQLPLASTTKIMTALLALEQPDLDAMFVVDAAAIQVEGSSMGLKEEDQVSLRTLAVGMLLSSGNDAANAAAVRISGSVPAFVELMNQKAQTLGLQNTSFETPSGLDGEDHYSSAYDLALLAREALRNDVFRSICSQYKMRISYGNPPYDRWLTNHNKLLNYYEGTYGVKTGFTKKAGRCLVSAAEQNGVQLIIVTLNCPDDWNTHEQLYDRYFQQLEVEDLASTIPDISIPVTGGTVGAVSGVAYDKAQFAVPTAGADITYQIQVQPFLYAPVSAGQSVGTAEIFIDGAQVATVTLIAGQDIPLKHPYEEEAPGLWDRILSLFS